MPDAPHFEFSTAEPFQKAKRAALTYSALVVALLVAEAGDKIKLAILELQIATNNALILLLVPASFYTIGFWIEHRRTVDRNVVRRPSKSLAAFDEQVELAGREAHRILKGGKEQSDSILAAVEQQATALEARRVEIMTQLEQVSVRVQEARYKARDRAQEHGVDLETAIGQVDGYRDQVAENAQKLWEITKNPELNAKFDDTVIKQRLEAAEGMSTAIPKALDRLATNVRRLHKDVHGFDRRSFFWYDLASVYSLYMVAIVGTIFHLMQPGRPSAENDNRRAIAGYFIPLTRGNPQANPPKLKQLPRVNNQPNHAPSPTVASPAPAPPASPKAAPKQRRTTND